MQVSSLCEHKPQGIGNQTQAVLMLQTGSVLVTMGNFAREN